MGCHGGEAGLPNHSRIRRKGVGWGLEVLSAVGPHMLGTALMVVILEGLECTRPGGFLL